MKLYTYFRSSAAYRVRIALNIKNIAFETIPKALLKGEHRASEYLQLNPQGLVPALAVDGTVLSQSLAIIEYLEERHPSPPLLPTDALARAQVRSMASTIACDIHPLNNLRVMNYLRQNFGQEDAGIARWYQHWVAAGFQGLESQVRQLSSSQRYCFGDSVSIADLFLAPQMYNARRFNCDLTPFPTLVSISTHLESLSAFSAARPEVQPDAQ